jgi:hypothetical protein
MLFILDWYNRKLKSVWNPIKILSFINQWMSQKYSYNVQIMRESDFTRANIMLVN